MATDNRRDGPPGPGTSTDDTLAIVRDRVRGLLSRSAAFRALPQEAQKQVAHDTVKVARFIADAGGETHGLPMTAFINNPAAVRAMSGPAPPPVPGAPDSSQRDFANAQDSYSNPATSGAGSALASLVDAVDFPNFVGGLIEGVFNAIVKTSIEQMEAYAAMVANVAKSVDQYMQDNVSSEQAKDQLIAAQPDLFEARGRGDSVQLGVRSDASADQLGGFMQSLGLPFDLDPTDQEVLEQEVVPAMRKSMAMDRQKLLATMVLMGINRIVVTDGRIQASVTFDINARDVLRRNQEINTSFSERYNQRYNRRKRNGWWIFSTGRETENARLSVRTNTDTTQTDESESMTQLKARLTGNVDLRFKSDYFPLEKMLDMLGTDQTVITQVAQQPTPQQAQQVQPIAAPPAPALPPPPGFAGGPAR